MGTAMTPNDFSKMINTHLLSYFPQLKTYVLEQNDTTRRKWANMFLGIETSDLRLAMDEFTSGKEKLPFHRDEVFSKLRQMSRAYRDVRWNEHRKKLQDQERAEQDEIKRERQAIANESVGEAIIGTLESVGCGGALREIMARTDQGEDGDVVTQEVLARLRREWGMA